ncbi:DUF5627 domain-containing protein [Rufibacter latericius]|uniref:DUF1735 domain-containing protein n=1 Tax=Rufibacter latericius TaxID=2487040 RepID=A0A3M9MMW1_9BACT|nr:DUF5627 domain-containing protein [Rufibacter latericius]RNI26831.1 DUF1735 domain-containing protein [Rufibacter latericius]
MKKIYLSFLSLLVTLTSCENEEWEFPDNEFQSTYFAYQYPVRTIVLGEDIFDTTLDNQHKCNIMATTGGVYENKKDVTIAVEVDNSLSAGLLFSPNGDALTAMPSNYYKLASDKIIIPQGKTIGGVEVQLTDEFFADPLALKRNYVIPMRMTSVHNADSILLGKPLIENPNRAVAGHWSIVPKDFVLYAVKYVNPWHGFYLRRGKDVIEGKNGDASLNQTIVRHKPYVENDEVVKLTTQSLSQVELPVVFKDKAGKSITCNLLLSFAEQGSCTISTNASEYKVTGTGKFVKRGEKKSWGNADRDALYLSYKIELEDMNVTSTDTVVLRDRGVAMETYTPVLK